MKHVESANAVLGDIVNTFNFQGLKKWIGASLPCYGYTAVFGNTFPLMHS